MYNINLFILKKRNNSFKKRKQANFLSINADYKLFGDIKTHQLGFFAFYEDKYAKNTVNNSKNNINFEV